MSSSISSPKPVVVIIGAGAFGLSTAYHLLERGYTGVTVLDRAEHLPAVDAASTDMNKVVRSCYGDPEYTRLARQAIEEWRKDMWQNCYHECGVLNLGDAYTEQSFNNDLNDGAKVERLDSPASIRAQFPSDLHNSGRLGTFTSLDISSTSYINHDGGWAEAERAVGLLMEHVKKRGVKVLPNKTVQDLVKDEYGQTKGVRCADGSEYDANVVVLALGSWTAGAFPSLKLTGKCLATGQSIAMIQLTPEEAEEYCKTPVVLDFRTGFYVFPPTHRNVVKFAIHAGGYTYTAPGSTLSTPRTIVSDPESGMWIPRSILKELRVQLRSVYPALAEKPFSGTRMCWYTDSPDGDWVIGRYPGDSGLVLATSGSGHAFKFLPILGKLVADVIEDKLDPKLAARFAVDREMKPPNGERTSVVSQELNINELCGPEDLIPTF
ncbi:FAD dependent oxidoreductase [Suillus clintonianus]|uniref:FAD dependent oxidoreductase n=1 Tax=Suillus clintonianus TaxID=1904413 RepID=UPI001B86276C|nr:FAD dependent oxidoreductase [Suillus clintonianus]KAG2153294.1 FAD dependent oxidoreductase [Suillus clintonianus]